MIMKSSRNLRPPSFQALLTTDLHVDIAEYHDAVFVVGALDETLILRGMRYHPIDIENSVLRAHKKIAEW